MTYGNNINMKKVKLAILGSTRGTSMQPIINAIETGNLDAKIEIVISNKKDAHILERAKKHKIEAIFIDHEGKTRGEFDVEITKILKEKNIDLILLIGYMRILSDSFVDRWQGKVINVHPSLLPKFAGGMDTNVHEEVLKAGEVESGCTIHHVTKELDGGEIILQKKCSVDPNETVESLKNKIQKLEGEAFVEIISKWNAN